MARLSPSEKQALLDFARQPPPPVIPFADYLRAISKLPPSLRPEKPVRFTGNHWKL